MNLYAHKEALLMMGVYGMYIKPHIELRVHSEDMIQEYDDDDEDCCYLINLFNVITLI